MWLAILSIARAVEVPVALDALPGPVLAAVARAWPSAHPLSAAREGSEVELELVDGVRRFEATFLDDGTLVETEEEADPASLPPAVRAAAEARGKVLRAELLTGADGSTGYDLVVRAGGKHLELELDAAGQPRADEGDDGDEDE